MVGLRQQCQDGVDGSGDGGGDRCRQGRAGGEVRGVDLDNPRGRPGVVEIPCEREDGGRGFGFTGAHFHKNWGDDNFRKLVLNAILWTAKAEVPADGVQSSVTAEQLQQNLDDKRDRRK